MFQPAQAPRQAGEARRPPQAETGGPAAFALEQVSLQLGKNQVLREIDLSVPRGERVAVIGPSGAGKTSLLRLCAAALAPTQGKVLVLGRDTRGLSARALRSLRSQVGFLYQSDNLVPQLRVVHNVLMGNLGRWSAARSLVSLLFPREIERASAALRDVELAHKLWDLPGALSGGEQQRVALARLFVQDPVVILADEPASALDLRLGRDIVRRLSDLAGQRGRTLLVSLHALELLPGHFDRVVALREGRTFWQGPAQSLSRGLLFDLYGAEYRALHLDQLEL